MLANIVTKVCATAANGLPLGSEEDVNFYKTYFLDIGLVCTALDLNYLSLAKNIDLTLVNAGKVAEQFMAQHLLYMRNYFEKPKLYYWIRENKSSSAEIDFLMAHHGMIIPIEVKAGASGSLKSLHYFLQEKNLNLGVRFSTHIPSLVTENIKLTNGKTCNYNLLSLPLYLVEESTRIVETCS